MCAVIPALSFLQAWPGRYDSAGIRPAAAALLWGTPFLARDELLEHALIQ